MADLEPTLERFRTAYDNPEYQKGLNVALREALKLYASAAQLDFVQDNAGNIHVSQHGRDPDLADIAISFQLDEHRSRAACQSAFRVFYELQRENLLCGVTLLGWSSVGDEYVGRHLWESAGLKTQNRPSYPEVQQFSNFADVSTFQLSAVFEVVEEQQEQLQVEGATVLVEQIQELADSPISARLSPRKQSRAPGVCLRGPGAERVACGAIKAYSSYIGALFDNFD
ncbi:hypothetical protein G647_01607 [Cladophialophora carrionii CBS 160.54]|uniref:Uncharacterized protein n=1 Tax=Cladophialophora carrionii CBS 160.54 TaxID=1279043 RepID=V9DQG3_9EURO|nr:uncharacterized protein G647_01607 [Cladophialophora carrionii CBS 160.54]ETI29154.1 hypothetical protein G647_01607 [Cladophialophora carrionii CBS 160.54]